MPLRTIPAEPQRCGRCGQLTRYFWLEQGNELLPWCNFCVAAQVLCYIGAEPASQFVASFTRAIESQRAEDVRFLSTALRELALRLHETNESRNEPDG
jgi:hypothetical protein